MYYVTACPDITPPQCEECITKERGRVRGLAFIKEDFSFVDITDKNEWDTGILAGDIFLLPQTRGSVSVSQVETEGFGDTKQSVDGYDYEINAFDPNYSTAGGNCTFWNDMRKVNNYKVAYKTETKVHVSDVTASVAAMNPVEDDLNSTVLWNVIIKFSQEDAVCPQVAPADVFVCSE